MSKLEELKVGDEVVVTESTTKRIAKIERVTKLYLVVDGVRYNRRHGWATGYTNKSTIMPVTENLWR